MTNRDLNTRLEETGKRLFDELRDKPVGYTLSVDVTLPEIRDSSPKQMEIVLLDPELEQVAFRRVADLGLGQRKDEWLVGDIGAVIEETRLWMSRLEKNRAEIERRTEERYEE